MSMLTKAAGLDALIAAAKKQDWETVLSETEKLIRKYAGAKSADAFTTYAIRAFGEVQGGN
jgi:hypothetical protein